MAAAKSHPVAFTRDLDRAVIDEVHRAPDLLLAIIARAFQGAVPDMAEALSKEKLSEWVTTGGYPEAIKRRSEHRRQDWYRAYVKSIVERDLPEISNLARPESFVFSELLKLSAWAEDRVLLFHYRDRDQLEIDFILENSAGELVGIEMKSAASVTRRDFLGLERVANAAGSAFMQGIVLYDGAQTLSFADKLRAVPISALRA